MFLRLIVLFLLLIDFWFCLNNNTYNYVVVKNGIHTIFWFEALMFEYWALGFSLF